MTRWLLGLGAGALAALLVVALFVRRAGLEVAAGTGAARVGLGQHHMLASIHSRRGPSFQLTWNAPDGATGYTVYVARTCPSPASAGPADAGPADAGPADAGPADAGPADAGPADAGPADAGPADAGPAGIYCPGEVSLCSALGAPTTYDPDAGTCACDADGGATRACNLRPISAGQIAAGGCANPALCCVTYPGVPAPAGQHDGIVISQCWQTATANGGPIETDGGRCCTRDGCWYPPPNFPLDGGGIGTPDGQAPYSGVCWEALHIERGYYFDTEAR